MSKVVIYVLDKFVWMLLITILATQALQIAGIVEPSKDRLEDIAINEENEYQFGISVGAADTRGKRQTGSDGEPSALIENIFNIPIATLNAVNNLVQSTRPAFQRLREHAQRRIEAANAAAAANQAVVQSARKQRAPRVRESLRKPGIQEDGASSKVLLNV